MLGNPTKTQLLENGYRSLNVCLCVYSSSAEPKHLIAYFLIVLQWKEVAIGVGGGYGHLLVLPSGAQEGAGALLGFFCLFCFL